MMKIKQIVDGVEQVGEVSEDTANFMVDRGFAVVVEDGDGAHDVAPSAIQDPLLTPEVTAPKTRKQDA